MDFSFLSGSALFTALATCVELSQQIDAHLEKSATPSASAPSAMTTSPHVHCCSCTPPPQHVKENVKPKLCLLVAGVYLNQSYHKLILEQHLTAALQLQSGLKAYVDAAWYDENSMRPSEFGESLGATKGHTLDKRKSTHCLLLQAPSPRWRSPRAPVVHAQASPESVVLRLPHQDQTALCQDCGPTSEGMPISHQWLHPVLQELYIVLSRCLHRPGWLQPEDGEFLAHQRHFHTVRAVCDIHSSARTHTKVFNNFLASHVRGLLHTAVSLQEAATLSLFRQCLRAVIRDRLRIVQGVALASQRAYKAKVLSLFLAAQSSRPLT